MRRLIGLTLLFLALSHPAWAGSLILTTTDDQDRAIGVLLQKVNAERAALTPPSVAWTRREYVEYLLTQWVDGVVTQAKTYKDEQLRKAADTTTDGIKLKIENLLTCHEVVCP
jgi:hypothetical protein